MPLVLGSNIGALKTIGRLTQTSSALDRSLERLSSGARINRASDDPAGLATASVINQKTRVLNRATANLNDGVSLLNIADGALGQISDALSRMIELSEQAANGSFSAFQRLSLHREFAALDREIQRISESTDFNGVRLLRGSRRSSIPTDIGVSSASPNVSANGRYIGLVSVSDQVEIFDTTTNTRRTYAIPTGTSFVYDVKPANGGNFIVLGESGGATDVYFFDTATGQYRKLTNSQTGSGIVETAWSADESTIAIQSQTYYRDRGTVSNVAGTGSFARLVVLDIASGILRQGSDDLNGASGLTISADGRFLAFSSLGNYSGQNSDGNYEIFTASTQAATLGLRQLTVTTGVTSNFCLGISLEGRVWLSSRANLTGANPSGVTQLFEMNMDGSNAVQRTSFSGVSVGSLAVGVDGGTYTFSAQSNLTGENPGGYSQIFRLNFNTGTFEQLTNFSSEDNTFAIGHYVSRDGSVLFAQDGGGDSVFLFDLTRDELSLDFEAGFGARGRILTDLQALTTSLRGLGQYSITSVFGARSALDKMREGLDNVAGVRGTIGAGLSRIEVAARLTDSQRLENLSALGRIRDADIATESAGLVRNQILQQASTSLLANVNQQPALALSLLRTV